jgi:hypothetical protein
LCFCGSTIVFIIFFYQPPEIYSLSKAKTNFIFRYRKWKFHIWTHFLILTENKTFKNLHQDLILSYIMFFFCLDFTSQLDIWFYQKLFGRAGFSALSRQIVGGGWMEASFSFLECFIIMLLRYLRIFVSFFGRANYFRMQQLN